MSFPWFNNDAWRSIKLYMFRPETSMEACEARAEVHFQEAAEEVWRAANLLTEPDEEPISRAQRRAAYLQMAANVFDRLYPERK